MRKLLLSAVALAWLVTPSAADTGWTDFVAAQMYEVSSNYLFQAYSCQDLVGPQVYQETQREVMTTMTRLQLPLDLVVDYLEKVDAKLGELDLPQETELRYCRRELTLASTQLMEVQNLVLREYLK